MPYKYMRVCPICQRPCVVILRSHLEMVHDLNADERSAYLKRAILSAPMPSIQALLPKTTVKPKLKKIRQDRQVVRHSHKSSERKPIVDVLPEPYPSFRFRHKFSLMVVGPSMSGKKATSSKNYWKENISNTRIIGNVEKYIDFTDSIKICLRT